MAAVTKGYQRIDGKRSYFLRLTFEWMFQQKSGRFNSAKMTERDGRTGKHLAALGV